MEGIWGGLTESECRLVPAANGGGTDAGFRLARRLRAVLSRNLYGEGTQIIKPTAHEYQEITSRHRR
ncbi:hypothetical protein GCM10011579_000360 [Streptomyces albiflavescens]|uniref:Uncharacterized protein n=1 Tax=Streptomyces albiflavescens TaxID=1623582 RepID=A0A918CY94_9ACTN|nr:hypothetical protein [Streptomyces albiflavescens]GGN48078.1 hypothetical protein GCM10011579_000360 [Streptomyces albiflavescens]